MLQKRRCENADDGMLLGFPGALIGTFRRAAPARCGASLSPMATAGCPDERVRPWSRRSPRAFRRVDYGDSWRSAGQAAKAGSGFGALGFAVRASVGRVAGNASSSRRSVRLARREPERITRSCTFVLIATFRRAAPARSPMSGASWRATKADECGRETLVQSTRAVGRQSPANLSGSRGWSAN
jgi:hypothetical protein